MKFADRTAKVCPNATLVTGDPTLLLNDCFQKRNLFLYVPRVWGKLPDVRQHVERLFLAAFPEQPSRRFLEDDGSDGQNAALSVSSLASCLRHWAKGSVP